jgi:hypothetical protein
MQTRIDASEPDDGGPEDLGHWLTAGFAAEEAEIWRRWRFSIAQARSWKSAGVDDGLQAAQWSTAAVAPDTVTAWRAAGIDAVEAVRWHEFGYGLELARSERQQGRGPDQTFALSHPQTAVTRNIGRSSGGLVLASGGRATGMRRFLESGVDHMIMRSYLQCQWTDESALAWATHGIDAGGAYTWHELGLTPSEAGRLVLQGRSAGEVVGEWWGAGIPFGEFADWLGAGLSAAEAAEQRARGITAEHAAALRALRQEEPEAARPGRQPAASRRLGPPVTERRGPPPADEQGARAQICAAFSAMLTPDEAGVTIPSVDGGDNLGDCLAEAALRHGVMAAGTSATVHADLVQFINAREAWVTYSVTIAGRHSMQLGDRAGRAVLAGDEWKVTRDTFCQFMQIAGVQCPPRNA